MHRRVFDALRGIAAIVVLFGHVVQIFILRLTGPFHPLSTWASACAQGAVIVFFLLSGYLITLSIRSNLARNGHFEWRDYLLSRVTRIYPPLVGAIVVVAMAWAIIHAFGLPGAVSYRLPTDLYAARESFAFTWKDVPRVLLMESGMLDADGPLWSLYMEFHIYLIVMFAVMRRAWIGIALALFAFWTWQNPSFAWFAGIWGIGAALSWARIPEVHVPQWLARTGDFSYSLYVIHFPLLLLGFSLTRDWIGASLGRTLIVTPLLAICVLAIAHGFALYFEAQQRFKPRIRGALRFVLRFG